MSVTIVRSLDLKGLSCPLPIIKTAEAIKDVASGELIEAFVTDAGSVSDFNAWSWATRNVLVEQREDAGVYRFIIRKR